MATTTASREFTPARKEQGFRDQAHLDAFFTYYDHTKTCAECLQPGPGYDAPDGWQPTENRCDTARTLSRLF
jgi:hypothetical protein